ncbi:MAG: hypothetical protein L3K08_08995 [Thermoplasmata archaeon]|nr:hypothetical protein [Thermoplasmata archaeon]
MTKFSTIAAKAELERSLSLNDQRRAALAAMPDEMEVASFDAAFPVLLRQKPADAGPP